LLRGILDQKSLVHGGVIALNLSWPAATGMQSSSQGWLAGLQHYATLPYVLILLFQ